jgi:S1-C subfamily serine protease
VSPGRAARLGVLACCAAALALATWLPGPPLRAEAPKIEKKTLDKIKQATVYLRVKLPDGSVVEGSGFFADAAGVVVTNAHVLGMLEPNSRKPLLVQVTVYSGTPDSMTLVGRVLGVDRGSDLAALRVEGKKLPTPLKLASAGKLSETDDVYVFGYPFGRDLGKDITVNKTSVSSLRKGGVCCGRCRSMVEWTRATRAGR